MSFKKIDYRKSWFVHDSSINVAVKILTYLDPVHCNQNEKKTIIKEGVQEWDILQINPFKLVKN